MPSNKRQQAHLNIALRSGGNGDSFALNKRNSSPTNDMYGIFVPCFIFRFGPLDEHRPLLAQLPCLGPRRPSTARLDRVEYGVIALVVDSNHGEGAYTCIYRLRVHGTPSP